MEGIWVFVKGITKCQTSGHNFVGGSSQSINPVVMKKITGSQNAPIIIQSIYLAP